MLYSKQLLTGHTVIVNYPCMQLQVQRTMYQYVKIDILNIPSRIEAIYANLVQAYVHVCKCQQGTCSLRNDNAKRS